MLPAWATVAIALGGSAITAVLALTGALVTSRRQDVAQWRAAVLAAADDFSTGVGQALRALREAIAALEERELEFRSTKGESVETDGREFAPDGPQARGLWLCAEAVAVADDRLARVRLLLATTLRPASPPVPASSAFTRQTRPCKRSPSKSKPWAICRNRLKR
jgi:hypothetical protein